MDQRDAHHMTQAIRLARRGLGRAWPNPAVGAVVVAPSGEIVGRGWTAPGGRPHAEAIALQNAGEAARGSTVYVTLEPCAHEGGRGAPCSKALIAAGVARVVIGIRDPDPRTAGAGISMLEAAGIDTTEGVCTQAATAVTLGHILRIKDCRPAVTIKLAVGADGRIPRGEGQPVWITGPQARSHGHLLRARNDAILVGRGTVEADNPSLTCRLPGMAGQSPVRVVLDRQLRSPANAALFADRSVPVWMICAAGAPQTNAKMLGNHGAEILPTPVDAQGMIDTAAALQTLAGRGITRLLVEGGPAVAASFLNAGFVDEAVVYHGPDPAGPNGLVPFDGEGLDRLTANGHFNITATRFIGPDRMTWYRRN